MPSKKRILVAPLNWGLGHATRCIPIIKALLECNFEPIIASDGFALKLLQKEFPALTSIELPSYKINYSKNGFFLKWKLFKSLPKLILSIKKDQKLVENIIKTYDVKGIISDNRFGVYSLNKKIPSVYITHQLRVLSGATTWVTTKIHENIIKKHDQCWVPDFENTPNLSGMLGHIESNTLNLKYIGPLSRFTKSEKKSSYDIMLLLSGPEPQRTLLEKKVLDELKHFDGKVIIIQGKVEKIQNISTRKNFTIYNFMNSEELEQAILSSDLIISRSGYTSIMDFTKLEKNVFFIPTPGQNEQIYLAKMLQRNKIAPFCNQHDFSLKKLENIKLYGGFNSFGKEVNYKTLFGLFEGE